MSAVTRKKELLDNMLKEEVATKVIDLIRENVPITMEEVAKRCGVAKGTLYNYFTNRDALMEHVHESMIAPILASNDVIFSSNEPPLKKIHMFVDRIFGMQNDVCVYFKYAANQRTAADEMVERYELAVTPLVKICEEGIASGDFPNVEPLMLAEMIFGIVIGYVKSTEFECSQVGGLDKIKSDMLYLIDKIIIK